MKPEQFDDSVLQSIRRRPFEPFVVELLDGRVIEITTPKVIVGGGGATFIRDEFDLVDFECEEVRAIRAAVPGATA